MKISLEWLSDFIEAAVSPDELADIMSMSGMEVEHITKTGDRCRGIISARITRVAPHPLAKSGGEGLTVVTVQTGTGEAQVVCGASNCRVGDTVAFAPAGAVLPDDRATTVTAQPVKGVESGGILLSEKELGISDDHGGILILEPDLALGTDLVKYLHLTDTIMEVSITPNRPDLLSHYGVALDLKALHQGSILRNGPPIINRFTPLSDHIPLNLAEGGTSLFQVQISAQDGCSRYTARELKGVTVGPSPLWLKRRLHVTGMRPINNVVDATNYVMLELGNPLHAFDLKTLSGRTIVVRAGREGEKLTSLDGVERTLSPQDLLIADPEKPIALGGVMGGLDTEIGPHTEQILLEGAGFDPASVRRTARRHGIHSESSHRFERGVDPENALYASARAAQLIELTCPGLVTTSINDTYPVPRKNFPVNVQLDRMNSLLGYQFTLEQTRSILEALDMTVTVAPDGDGDGAGQVVVTAPTRRYDIERPADIAEEVARVYGYDAIPPRPLTEVYWTGTPAPLKAAELPVELPPVETDPVEPLELEAFRRKTGAALRLYGYSETASFSFISPEELTLLYPEQTREPDRFYVPLANPLNEELAVLRPSLLPGILAAAVRNFRMGEPGVALYELGTIYTPAAWEGDSPARDLPVQRNSLCIFGAGKIPGSGWHTPIRDLDFYDLKGTIEALLESMGHKEVVFSRPDTINNPWHPGATATIKVGGIEEPVGTVGELHPQQRNRLNLNHRLYGAELNFDLLFSKDGIGLQYTEIQRFPAIGRDVALLVDKNLSAGDILQAVREFPCPFRACGEIFDVFEGKGIPAGQKSIAISIKYQAGDRTLTDAEVNTHHGALVEHLNQALKAERR